MAVHVSMELPLLACVLWVLLEQTVKVSHVSSLLFCFITASVGSGLGFCFNVLKMHTGNAVLHINNAIKQFLDDYVHMDNQNNLRNVQ